MDVFLYLLHYHVNVKSTVVYRKKSTVTYISCVLKMFLISKSFIRYPFRCSLVTASFCIHSAPAARVTASSTDPRASPWTTSTTSWWRTGGTPGCRWTVASPLQISAVHCKAVLTTRCLTSSAPSSPLWTPPAAGPGAARYTGLRWPSNFQLRTKYVCTMFIKNQSFKNLNDRKNTNKTYYINLKK